MTAVKTNERPGTRAQVRYLRMSPSKARVVLDLIRGKHVSEAAEILAYSERLAAREITKVLRSAVANAQHNDDIPVQELYVSACYADEGPTLRRFRPRARGRAGRIAKRTCHITVIVSRLSDEELDELRNRAALRGRSSDDAAARRARVAKSRGEETAEATADEADADEGVAEEVATAEAETAVDETVVEETDTEEVATEETGDEATDTDDPAVDDGEPVADETASEETSETDEGDA